MKHFARTFTLILAALALAGLAFAQEAAAAGADVASWFVDTAALAAIVAAATAFVKANVIKSLSGAATVGVSLAIGAALGVSGHFLGYVEGGLQVALGFGITAGFLASGGWDVLRSALGKARAA